MAFSRYRSSGRRSFSARFRRRGFSGPRLSSVRRPIRWERGNFHLTALHLHVAPDRVINTVIPIAMINNLINAASDREHGFQLAEMTRALEIGGVKFTSVQELVAIPGIQPAENDLFQGSALMGGHSKILLCSDSTFTDPTDGLSVPSAIESNWFTNTSPVSRTQEVQDVQSLYPRRIHWQNYRFLNAGWQNSVQLDLVNAAEYTVPFGPQSNAVVSTHSSGNLKLRLRLQDDEALSWYFTSEVSQAQLDANMGAEIRFIVSGTIWYRYRM